MPDKDLSRDKAERPFATEEMIREALRSKRDFEVSSLWINEFFVPGTKERADLAWVGQWLAAYEIKTERDDLRRLPRQVAAFSRLFDRCTVVAAEKHLDGCLELVPQWWGILVASLSPTGVVLDPIREAATNPDQDSETLVRLLWKREVERAVEEIEAPSPPQASRQVLWAALLKHGSAKEIQKLVREALRSRDGASARLPSRRFNVGRPAADP